MRVNGCLRSSALIALSFFGMAVAAGAQTQTVTFTNNTPNPVPVAPATSGIATTYPSNIPVAGMTGITYHVRVKLNLTHTFPADLGFELVSPTGQSIMLMSSAGGGGDLVNTDIGFDDCATRGLRGSQMLAGQYRPTDVFQVTMPAPAPALTATTGRLSAFNWANPNGTWRLYVNDGAGGDIGQLNSWSLTISTQPAATLTAAPGVNPVTCTSPDYDGDGRADVAVYRPTTGEWFISKSGSNGALMTATWGAPSSTGFGDTDVPADYDADGVTDIAVYRQATGDWFVRRSFDLSVLATPFGAPSSLNLGDTPVPADYDGDGQADLAIYRASNGQWFLRSSAGLGVASTNWGFPAGGDNPAR